MAAITGALVSGGLSAVSGGLARRRNSKRGKDVRRKTRYILERQRANDAFFGGKERAFLEEGLERIREGNNAAKVALSRSGRASKRQALERGEQLQAQLGQAGVSSGIAPTFGRRALEADTARRLQDIDSQLGGLFADLEVQSAQTEAAGLDRLGSFFRRQGFNENNRRQQELEALVGTARPLAQAIDFSGLGSAIGGSNLSLFGG